MDWRQGWVSAVVCVWAGRCELISFFFSPRCCGSLLGEGWFFCMVMFGSSLGDVWLLLGWGCGVGDARFLLLVTFSLLRIPVVAGTWLTPAVGIYTFLRSLYRGGDSRFDNIRTDRTRFFTVFMLQGVWVTLCTVPVVALNSIPAEGFAGGGWWTEDRHTWVSGPWRMAIFWLGLWSFFRGFVIECLADWQLMKWLWDKDHKKHDEVFCATGLWEKRQVLFGLSLEGLD